MIQGMRHGFLLAPLLYSQCKVDSDCWKQEWYPRKMKLTSWSKTLVDVIFGGLGYWSFGYGLSFGVDEGSNAFTGIGYFFTAADEENMGEVYSKYIFQMSFATTATSIVSGAMAERTNLKAYMVYSFLNTLTYCFPAHWMWADNGFLKTMGAIDVAGCAPVHIVGGVSALTATLWLKPRDGKFNGDRIDHQMASPTNVMLGAFMLWWGWLGFNCGSTFGISGNKWKLASRAAVVTINGSIGGSTLAIFYSYFLSRGFKGKLGIPVLVTGLLGGLVSITGICAVCKPWEALVIGSIGGIIAVSGNDLMEKLKIDDPVGCISTHFFAGAWGLMAVAFFVEHDRLEGFSNQNGVFKGGHWMLILAQLAAIGAVTGWTLVITAILLFIIDTAIGLRVSLEQELLGADWCEHGIADGGGPGFFRNPRISSQNVTSETLGNIEASLSHHGIDNEGVDDKGIRNKPMLEREASKDGSAGTRRPSKETKSDENTNKGNTEYQSGSEGTSAAVEHKDLHAWFCIKNTEVKVIHKSRLATDVDG